MASLNADVSTSVTEWFERITPAYNSFGDANYLDSNDDLIEGIYADLPNDVYHSLPAFSSSLIKELVKNTPAHVYRNYFSDIERKRTTTQRNTLDTGTYGHELVLEDTVFAQKYFRVPLQSEYPHALSTSAQLKDALKEAGLKVTGTKAELVERISKELPQIDVFDSIVQKAYVDGAGFAALEAAKKRVERKECTSIQSAFDDGALSSITKKTPVDGLVWDDAHRIHKTFLTHARAKKLISNGYAELTMIARDPDTGLMLKVKFDYINKDAIASDVKTTRSANPRKFAMQCRDLSYDVQAEFYKYVANLAGVPVTLFAFISIEFLDADICEVFEINRTRQLKAFDQMKEGLSTLSYCLETEDWHGYSRADEIMVIDW